MKNYLKNKGITGVEESEEERFAREEYLKEIMTFRKPVEIENRIGKDIPNLFEYDLVCDFGKTSKDGHLEKRFVRLHNGYFSEYFKEAKKRKLAYVTYIKDRDLASGHVPQNVSVLLKEIGLINGFYSDIDIRKMYAEVIGSRILNYFGVKTVYNKALLNGDKFYILSIDFLRSSQYFYTAGEVCSRNEIFAGNSFAGNLSSVAMDIDILKHRVNYEFGAKNVSADKEQILKEFVMTYLVRVFLLGDIDFKNTNYGFIYDRSKNEIMASPNYDFEYTFGTSTAHLSSYNESVKYISKNYPEVLEEFLKKLKPLSKNRFILGSKFLGIAKKEIEQDYIINEFNRIFSKNADYIFKFHELLSEVDKVSQKGE